MMIFLKRIWLLAKNITLVFIISIAFYTTIPIETKPTIYIPKGSITHIISHLTKKGLALTPIDKYILRMIGNPKSGWVDIGQTRLNRIDFLYQISYPKSKIQKITLIPGETREIFFGLISKQLNLDKEILDKYYKELSPYPEAGIYPDTYHLPYGIKEKNLITFLIKLSEKKYKNLSTEIYGDYNQTRWLKILTIASIIQKEAGSKKEMPIVSSVIYNRLAKNMRLQMDGTLNYGKYPHIKVTSKRIKEDKTSFNTYKKKGLPHSPIGAVSITAIKSAINPAKTNYLYFMLNKDGVHDFTDTFKKHRRNIRNAN